MKYIVCNLKNKLNLEEIREYVDKLSKLNINKNIIILPSYPYIPFFYKCNCSIGAQDISSFIDTTITGEVNGDQLKSLGCKYVLVGHSERKINKKEINIDFINKINNAQENDLSIIYCIGENKQEKENMQTYNVLEKQISEVLNNVSVKNIMIAYEPIWAIGTGESPSKTELINIIDYIKETVMEKYNIDINVLYGGSVSDNNISELTSIKNLDGLLIGNYSIDSNNIQKIIDTMDK